MKTDKLFNLLSSLGKLDFKKFDEFLRSPYYNKLNDVVRLYSAVKKHYPSFNSTACTPEKLFGKIYPGEKFDYGRYRVLASRTLTLAKKFISVEKSGKDKVRNMVLLAHTVNTARNKNIYSDCIAELEMLLDEKQIKDEHYFHELHELAYLKNISTGHFSGGIEYGDEVNNLMIYSLARLLRIYATWINTNNSLNIPLDTKLLDKLELIIDDEPFSSNPVIQINHNIMKFAKNFTNEKYFFEHLRLTEKYPNAISETDLYDTYILLLNFCAVKTMSGDKSFNGHKFELYKRMLDKRLFFIQYEFIPYEMYNNIVGAAIETGNIKWAEGFVERYKNNLEEFYRNDIYLFSRAKICFAKREFEKSIEFMSGQANIENPFYKFAVKELMIKSYYELGYYENILSLIDSYKHTLSKSKLVNRQIRESRNSFLNALNSLVKCKMDDDTEKLKELSYRLNNSEHFVNKEWLIEKIR